VEQSHKLRLWDNEHIGIC